MSYERPRWYLDELQVGEGADAEVGRVLEGRAGELGVAAAHGARGVWSALSTAQGGGAVQTAGVRRRAELWEI